MDTNFSFQLGLINSCLGFVANGLAFVLTAYFGRRTIYLYGTAFNVCCLVALGVAATVSPSQATNYAQACLGIIISFTYALAMGPITYTIIAETSSVRLRALSTGIGRGAYYLFEIPLIFCKPFVPVLNTCIVTNQNSGLADVEPNWLESRRKVWLRLGWNCLCLFRHCLLLPSRT